MTSLHKKNMLSQIPQVDKVLQDERIVDLLDIYPRDLVTEHIRHHLGALRKNIMSMDEDKISSLKLNSYEILRLLFDKLCESLQPNLRRVVNAAGIILNTGLGRAPLSKAAQKALIEVSEGFSSVEIDLTSGNRGNRHLIVEDLIVKLTGAEAAAVVNNNAAATLLALNTLAFQKETIISRGELVTIGGSFRIPDIMKKSGAIMREIGTTNHTKSNEYENAITGNTGLLLKVHTSNYKIVGFTSETSLEELVTMGKKYDLPVMHDLGSGMLFDISRYGLPKEPVVSESIKAGADVVTFSGDKLLGGPQAGIIVGKKKYIDLIKENQLTRALRCGKLTFAALEATLRLFFDKEKLLDSHPALKMMLRDEADIKKHAMKLKKGLKKIVGENGEVCVEKSLSEIGGGSLATESLPTRVVTLKLNNMAPADLSKKLRFGSMPIVTRIWQDSVLFDVRTLLDNEHRIIIDAIKVILEKGLK